MDKKDIDWSNLGFGYIETDKRFVSNFQGGAWDKGVLTSDATIAISECAGVLQYAQTCLRRPPRARGDRPRARLRMGE